MGKIEIRVKCRGRTMVSRRVTKRTENKSTFYLLLFARTETILL
jgi:hypothetical protein